MDLIGITALVLSAALWLFNPQPVRRFLGLERPDPEPLWVQGGDITKLRRHELISPHLPQKCADELLWLRVDQEPPRTAQGYRRFTVAERRRGSFGRMITEHRPVMAKNDDHRGTFEVVLCWRPEFAPEEVE